MRPILFGLLLAISACAPAQTPDPNAPGTTTAQSGDPDMVCKEETQVGSQIPRKVCRSKLQEEQDKRDAEDLIRTPRAAPVPAGGN